MAGEEGVLHDHDAMGEKAEMSHEEVVHLAELSPEEKIIEKKLRRLIDSIILPLVILVYLMNYIDRNNYASAKLQGLMTSLHMTDADYQTGLAVLFVGYILMQVPSNLLLNHIGRPSLYLGFFVVAWGMVSALTSQVTTFGGIVACRFILGLVEAPFFAGVLFYLSSWYTKKELAFRMSIFYAGSLLSGAFGSLLAAGILSGLAGARGMEAWQWLYIIEGSITCFIGLLIMAFLPDFPETWKLLSPEMKAVALRRMAMDAADADVDEAGGMSQLRGAKMAFRDKRTYVFALGYMFVNVATGFQYFFPTLTATLGYNNVDSLLLVAPPYIFQVIWSLAHNYLSDTYQKRFIFWTYPIPVAMIGCIIFMTTDSFGPRYFSLFLMNFAFAMIGTMFGWIGTTIPRPRAKRAAAYAFINSIGNSASIWTPYTYLAKDAPHYRPALGVVIAALGIAFGAGLFLYIDLRMENKRLERMEREDGILSERDLQRLQRTAEVEGIDIAAARRLQKGFRYVL